MTAPQVLAHGRRGARDSRSFVAATLGMLAGVAILVSLGVWQMQRLSWKEGLLAEIDSRIHAAPQPLPAAALWPSLEPEDYEYRHVSVTGTFEHQNEALVFQGVSGLADAPGPGYLVLTPLRLDDGSHVIVNRGFVPAEDKDPASRAAGEIAGPTTITGLMRSPEERNLFTPADDPQKNLYFTRDPALIAAHFALAGPAPFTIDADQAPVPGGLPHGGTTIVDIPNDHFEYALTWFGLAAALVGVYAASIFKRARQK
jgi:surfeit locus 1 family protein